jgi:uncharacterized protein HemX
MTELPPQVPESDDAHFQPIKEMDDIDRRQAANSAARLMSPEPQAALPAPDTISERRLAPAGVAVVGVATAAILGGGLAYAAEGTAESNEHKNQAWSDQQQADQHRQDFENGLDTGKVTIVTPSSQETVIPSPQQIEPSDQPPLNSPITH